jgi:type II secretory pathway pseudopilin PulG
MTLVEIVLAVSLISMLTVLLVPAVNLAIRSRENARCASQLRSAIALFELYRSEMGTYPPDQNVPGDLTVTGMADYFNSAGMDWWGETTELGGRWDWDLGYHGYTASVSIWKPTASRKQLTEFDGLVDDGDLASGRFIQVSTQYHYILEE